MKLAIILISCIAAVSCIRTGQLGLREGETLVEGYLWGRTDDSTRRYECQYVADLQVLSCFRGVVECETIAHFEDLSQNFELFGIGSTDMVKYHLYPRNFSDSTFRDYRVQTTSGSWSELSLYATGEQPVTTGRGLMVKDAACFKRLIDMWRVIDNQVMVELSNKQKVTMLGYINYLSSETLKVQRELNNGTLPFGSSLGKKLDLDIGRKFDRVETETIVAGNPLLAPVSGAVWGSLEDTNRRFECQYSAELMTLSCFRGLIRCETIPRMNELTQNYEILGLGTTDQVTYRLYPRNYADVTFSDYRVPGVGGRTVELSLLRSGVEGQGLVVRDAVCYQRIIDFLRVITEPVLVDVTGDNTNTKVQMMGYIINV